MDLQLTGKTAFITGASGGIGRALARAFAEEGCNLALHANSNLDWLRKFIDAQPWNDRAIAVQADVANPDAVQQAMDQAAARFGRVDICVANAGRWPKEDQLLSELSIERFRQTLEVNLLGAAWTARAFMRQLKPREDGHGAALTFIGSTAGRHGEPMHCDYSASKAGMYGLVRSLKSEVVRLDPFARVNMVEPGWTVTEMAREALDQPGKIAQIVKTVSLRQLARAADIARAVVMLSSPGASRHISGEVLTVAGGMEGRTIWNESDIDEAAIRKRARE
ncbi:MAG: SDR family oxidoreductase [Planctomycetes bacterium]|nr:SDR family oxidoreductase [Planctomycetota bacterium]